MQIVINLDVEAIVRDAIYAHVEKNLVINNVPGTTSITVQESPETSAVSDSVTVTVESTAATPKEAEQASEDKETDEPTEVTQQKTTDPAAPENGWEYAPKPGRRRSKADMAMHDKELALGRRLTPEEKGQVQAYLEMDEEAEAKAKEETKKKARIDKIAEEGMAAAKKELAEEAAAAEEARKAQEAMDAEANSEESPSGIIGESRAAEEAGTTNDSLFSDPVDNSDAEEKVDTEPTDDGPQTPKTDDLKAIDSLFS